MTLAQLLAALHAFKQPVMNYCGRCGWWYLPSHWPCR